MQPVAGAQQYPVPMGYAYDPTSGYFHDAEVSALQVQLMSAAAEWRAARVVPELCRGRGPRPSGQLKRARGHRCHQTSFMRLPQQQVQPSLPTLPRAQFPLAQAGMYFDRSSGLYYSQGRWYTTSAAGQFVEWAA